MFSLFGYCQDNDTRLFIWNTSNIRIKLDESNGMKISMKNQYQTNNDLRDMTYVDASYAHKINEWLKLGAAIRRCQYIKSEGDLIEYRPQFITNVTAIDKGLKLTSINRIAYRYFKIASDHVRYYHNVYLHFPSLLKSIPRLYIAEELFTQLNETGLHIKRLYGGLHLLEKNWLRMDLFYVYQKLKSVNKWKTDEVVGLNLTFSI